MTWLLRTDPTLAGNFARPIGPVNQSVFFVAK
jgi:hypothetical protein